VKKHSKLFRLMLKQHQESVKLKPELYIRAGQFAWPFLFMKILYIFLLSILITSCSKEANVEKKTIDLDKIHVELSPSEACFNQIEDAKNGMSITSDENLQNRLNL